MRVAVFNAPMSHFNSLMSNMARGIDAEGDEIVSAWVNIGTVEADAALCWGWRKARLIRRNDPGIPILVMERGYVGDRFEWTSLGWNGLNRRAIFPTGYKGGVKYSSHFNQLIEATMKPWRNPLTPGYALILGQVQSDQACINANLPYQYNAWARTLSRAGYKVMLRPHPKAPTQAYGLSRASYTRGTLAEDLAGAKFTVSWNSNSSLDSVLQGVPSVTFDEGAMAWPVTSHNLNDPVTMPARAEWVSQLAWCQWQPWELVNGAAWRAVKAVKP